MAPVTALVIGCGVAGPVIAVLLKRKGYNPIVFEKVKKLGDAGASLMLMPNGLKVLDLVGVTAELENESLPLEGFLDCTSSGEVLGSSDLPRSFKQRYGQHAMGVIRTNLNLKLKDMLIEMGVEVREGWQLENIEEGDNSVTAHFSSGRSVTGILLIGGDGIKAASRRILLKRQGLVEGLPPFSGLTQTGGLSSTPKGYKGKPCMRNCYGEGVHMVSYPVSSDVTSWAMTLPESETISEASWGLFPAEEMEERKRQLLERIETWSDPSSKALVRSTTRMMKFGLFDREEMMPDQWYTPRCLLVGDAHPTSPHLGQGANQALEDCYHLSHALPDVPLDEDDRKHLLVELKNCLPKIFKEFAEKRQPRTSALVKGARTQGQTRVVTGGTEACRQRDEKVAAAWQDLDAITAKYDGLCQEPFQGVLA